MLKTLFTFTLLIIFSMSATALNYTVSFDNAKAHYVSVSIDFDTKDKSYVDFKVPVWTPGSYKVREFSNAFENVQAGDLEVSRIDKNTWRINTEGVKGNVKLTYEVYCFTVSVRQSYADENYAYLHGVSAFGYLDGFANEQIVLKINPYKGWNNVEVALPQTKAMGYVFTCDNYDLLADSPIAIGNFDVTSYTSGKVPHHIVMIGEGNYNLETVKEDFKKISDSQVKMMGDHPSQKYVHFVYNVGSGGGGLEHLNSQCSMINRWAYTNKEQYRRFLGLIAHEYFHLWNVKRIRPRELGPFDYDKENYTDMLWIAEGITSYYDDLTLYKLDMFTKEEYLKVISNQIDRYENTPGKNVMTLAESSQLAWVKSYLPKEESINTEISYYNKGMLAALLLDLEIRKGSKKCLDDVMTTLYKEYYKKGNRGFTHDEFIITCNIVAGRDLTSFFKDMIFSTKPIDYKSVFSEYGIDIVNKNESSTSVWSGVISKVDNQKVVITNIYSNSPAVEAGLSVNDEIIAVNGWRLTDKLEGEDSKYADGDQIEITYERDHKLGTTSLKYSASPKVNYELTIADETNANLKAWLN